MDGSDLKPLFFDLTKDSLALLLASRFKAPSYCASQIYDWVYRKGVRNPASMTNVKKALREELGSLLSFQPINYKNYLKSRDGTFKFLFEFEDGECVESVLINQDGRYTICVSSQAGCALGCRFCCTAKIGLRRNLSTSEIISQILSVSSFASRLGIEASSIVFMGMGEPLHNFKRVVSALKILTDPDGLGFSERKITLSTSGLVPAISDLYKTGLRVNLAVSLNATTDKVRTELMPINRRYPISLLLDTLKKVPLKKRQKLTIEYVMIEGVNDTDEDLLRLPRLLQGLRCKVNLIPYNESPAIAYSGSGEEKARRWQRELCARGLFATVRLSKGADIMAACGLLAASNQLPKKRKKLVELDKKTVPSLCA